MSEASIRAKPGNLVMSEAVPHCQQWTYHGEHSIKAMLGDGYFQSVKDMIRTGDMLRLVQIKDDRVQCTQFFMVVTGGATPSGLTLSAMSDLQSFDQTDEAPLAGEFHVKKGFNEWKVQKGEEVVESFKTKKEAEAHIETLAA